MGPPALTLPSQAPSAGNSPLVAGSPLSRNCTQVVRCSSFLIPLVFFPILVSRLDQPSPRAETDTHTMHPPGQPSAQPYYFMAGKGLSSSENSVIISFRPQVPSPPHLPSPGLPCLLRSQLSAEVFSTLGRVFKQLQQRLTASGELSDGRGPPHPSGLIRVACDFIYRGAGLIDGWCRKARSTVGSTFPRWVGLSCRGKPAEREPASELTFLHGYCLSPCPDFPQGWTMTGSCKTNPFLPQVAFGQTVYHSIRKQTRADTHASRYACIRMCRLPEGLHL